MPKIQFVGKRNVCHLGGNRTTRTSGDFLRGLVGLRQFAGLRPFVLIALAILTGCATNSRYPAPPHVREGALAEASRWTASARRERNKQAASEKCLAALRVALPEKSLPAQRIANIALGRFLETNFDGVQLSRTEFTGPDGVIYRVRIVSRPGDWAPGLLRELNPIRPIRNRESAPLQWPGWGVPVVGVGTLDRSSQPFEPQQGYRLPVTVVADMRSHKGICETSIRLLNPENTNKVSIEASQRPLAADLYAPIDATFRQRNPLVVSLRWLFLVDRFSYPTRLIFMEPYDEKRIPVVLVHGLLSTPAMWREVVKGLQADPVIRKNFQFWAFFYPSGAPIPISALDLRKALRSVESRYPIPRGMVLVGHSMGGIISRAQASGSGGNALIHAILGNDAPAIIKRLPETPLLRDALVFDRDKNVRRLVLISVPHRGSNLALAGPSGFFASLIRLPNNLANAVSELSDVVTTLDLRRPPTSIAGLSPHSPFLQGLNQRPIPVPHHTILGDRGRGNSPRSSDGVVPYSSGHLDTAESEIIVPTGHGSFRHPAAIAELRRILQEHLAENPR